MTFSFFLLTYHSVGTHTRALAASQFHFFSRHSPPRALHHSLDNSSDGGARSNGWNSDGSIPDAGPLSRGQPGLGASLYGSVSHGGRLPAAALLPRPGLRTVSGLCPVWPRADDPRRGRFQLGLGPRRWRRERRRGRGRRGWWRRRTAAVRFGHRERPGHPQSASGKGICSRPVVPWRSQAGHQGDKGTFRPLLFYLFTQIAGDNYSLTGSCCVLNLFVFSGRDKGTLQPVRDKVPIIQQP